MRQTGRHGVRRLAILLTLSFFMVLPIAFAQGIPKEEVSSVMLDSIFVDKSLGADYLRLTFKTKRAGDMEGILNTKETVQKSLEYKGETGKRGNKIAQALKKRRV